MAYQVKALAASLTRQFYPRDSHGGGENRFTQVLHTHTCRRMHTLTKLKCAIKIVLSNHL